MGWIENIGDAINYIEDHIMDDLNVDKIASHVYLSPYYFQKGFSMLCGYTVGEYIRQRRLTLAGSELVSTNQRVIDIALKYGYDSPDSFTKAFARFHGVTPASVRKDGALLRSFASLKILFKLEGGNVMDYKIVEKESFTIIGVSRRFRYETAQAEIPDFWADHFQSEASKHICGMYGACIEEGKSGSEEFEYLIADNYQPQTEIAEGLVTRIIPKLTWAVFPCKGPMPGAIQETNNKIYSEWLPNCRDYEIAAGFNIEMYGDPTGLPQGTGDENYYSEIWIPVKKK